ncbi:hypothetical protein TCAP_00305 [Tolypocladium capitatum]|uniref:Uncharacterized protein n=1 Tax=Tolypocladium capitatum TaxID=45235 RepID=A0A2K3QQH0_9HYPO|nr:hypothetical protein TCAP_00305 [Tolypocladium capitatum]
MDPYGLAIYKYFGSQEGARRRGRLTRVQYYIELFIDSRTRFFASAWTNRLGLKQSPDVAYVLFAYYSKILD